MPSISHSISSETSWVTTYEFHGHRIHSQPSIPGEQDSSSYICANSEPATLKHKPQPVAGVIGGSYSSVSIQVDLETDVTKRHLGQTGRESAPPLQHSPSEPRVNKRRLE